MRIKPDNPLAIRQLARFRAAMEGKSKNIRELAEELHMCIDRARLYVKHLHATGECYISGWSRKVTTTHYPVASYRMGVRKDCPKPSPEGPMERQRRAMAKIRADKDLHERHLQRQRTARYAPSLDPVSAALFGRSAAP